eukprot:1408843-Rhodomonas_salina.1
MSSPARRTAWLGEAITENSPAGFRYQAQGRVSTSQLRYNPLLAPPQVHRRGRGVCRSPSKVPPPNFQLTVATKVSETARHTLRLKIVIPTFHIR